MSKIYYETTAFEELDHQGNAPDVVAARHGVDAFNRDVDASLSALPIAEREHHGDSSCLESCAQRVQAGHFVNDGQIGPNAIQVDTSTGTPETRASTTDDNAPRRSSHLRTAPPDDCRRQHPDNGQTAPHTRFMNNNSRSNCPSSGSIDRQQFRKEVRELAYVASGGTQSMQSSKAAGDDDTAGDETHKSQDYGQDHSVAPASSS